MILSTFPETIVRAQSAIYYHMTCVDVTVMASASSVSSSGRPLAFTLGSQPSATLTPGFCSCTSSPELTQACGQ